MLSRECSLWQRSKKNRSNLRHIRSPPFGGKTPPRDCSRPRTFHLHYTLWHEKTQTDFLQKSRLHARGRLFVCSYSSIVTCVPTPICDFNVRRSLLCMWMQALRAVPVVRRGRRTAAAGGLPLCLRLCGCRGALCRLLRSGGLIIRQLVDHLGDGIRAARRGEQEGDESDGEDGTHGDSAFLFAEEFFSYSITWFGIVCIICRSGNKGAPLAKFSCQFPHPLIQYVLLQRYTKHNI